MTSPMIDQNPVATYDDPADQVVQQTPDVDVDVNVDVDVDDGGPLEEVTKNSQTCILW